MDVVKTRSVKAEIAANFGLSEWLISTLVEQPKEVTKRVFIISAPDGKECAVTVESLRLMLQQAEQIEQELMEGEG